MMKNDRRDLKLKEMTEKTVKQKQQIILVLKSKIVTIIDIIESKKQQNQICKK